MKRQVFKTSTLFTVLLLLFSLSTQVYAVESRATYYIESQSSAINREAGKEIDIYYFVVANRTMDEIGIYYIQIQRSTDQQSWTTERTLHLSNYPEWIKENSVAHVGNFLYTVVGGYYYRARIGYIAKIDGDTETTYMYTDTIYVPAS